MFPQYHSTLLGLFVIICTIVVQDLVATAAHRKQKHCIPGVIDPKLGHQSFVFRSYRTHQNSLENIVPLVIPALLALFIGVNPFTLAVIIWVYAIARIMHMVLYYVIATDKNPSPRSYFYLIGLLANLGLLGVVAAKLLV